MTKLTRYLALQGLMASPASGLPDLTQGWPLKQTLERAHRFAGQICRLRGAMPDACDSYRPYVADWRPAEARQA